MRRTWVEEKKQLEILISAFASRLSGSEKDKGHETGKSCLAADSRLPGAPKEAGLEHGIRGRILHHPWERAHTGLYWQPGTVTNLLRDCRAAAALSHGIKCSENGLLSRRRGKNLPQPAALPGKVSGAVWTNPNTEACYAEKAKPFFFFLLFLPQNST